MICPNCKYETSDMLNACEWCGMSLVQPPGAPQGQYPAGAPQGQLSVDVSGQQYCSPGDASAGYGAPSQQQGAPRPGARPPARPAREWYMSPVFFIACGILVLGIVAGLYLGTRPARSYSGATVAGRPTMLDFYTDT
jgi:hypothetical protein